VADTTNPAAAAVNAVKEQQATPEAAVPKQDPNQDIWARKERQLRKMQQDLASERKKWQDEQEQVKQRYNSDYIPKSRLTEDPLTVLTESGLSYDKLTEMLLAGQ